MATESKKRNISDISPPEYVPQTHIEFCKKIKEKINTNRINRKKEIIKYTYDTIEKLADQTLVPSFMISYNDINNHLLLVNMPVPTKKDIFNMLQREGFKIEDLASHIDIYIE